MKWIINIVLFFQYLYFTIYYWFITFNEVIVIVNNHDKKRKENKTFVFNLYRLFGMNINKSNEESWLVRVDKNNYIMLKYDNNHNVIDTHFKEEINKHNIVSFKVNNKSINIIRYSGDVLIKDLLDIEMDNYDNDMEVEYMDALFDDHNVKIKDIIDKKICEV